MTPPNNQSQEVLPKNTDWSVEQAKTLYRTIQALLTQFETENRQVLSNNTPVKQGRKYKRDKNK